MALYTVHKTTKSIFLFFVSYDEIDNNWNAANPNACQFISYIEIYMYNVCGENCDLINLLFWGIWGHLIVGYQITLNVTVCQKARHVEASFEKCLDWTNYSWFTILVSIPDNIHSLRRHTVWKHAARHLPSSLNLHDLGFPHVVKWIIRRIMVLNDLTVLSNSK